MGQCTKKGLTMASVTAKEIPEVQQFFTELWNLYKKYYIPESSDEYWSDLVREFTELRSKYVDVSISKRIIDAITDDLDKKYMENRGTKGIEKN